jgi:3-oxoacyl-[acyl-carrier protein] reductase
LQADVSVPGEVRQLFDAGKELYGKPDVVVHCAGIATFASIADATNDDYDIVFDANARSTFATLREASNRVTNNGCIIVISSGAAVSVRPRSGLCAASKAACDRLVRIVAQELASRAITVNGVLSGPTRTETAATTVPPEKLAAIAADIPLGRLGEPSDIADVVAILASGQSPWITGQTIHAGGGMF